MMAQVLPADPKRAALYDKAIAGYAKWYKPDGSVVDQKGGGGSSEPYYHFRGYLFKYTEDPSQYYKMADGQVWAFELINSGYSADIGESKTWINGSWNSGDLLVECNPGDFVISKTGNIYSVDAQHKYWIKTTYPNIPAPPQGQTALGIERDESGRLSLPAWEVVS